jgi:hypothetical protein
MMPSPTPLILHMQTRLQPWEETAVGKALFLRCYMLMTDNVLTAVSHHEFHDPAWVSELLHRFADYYFVALQAYESDPASAPAVWQIAHNAAADPDVSALQKLLLGVNAHINYDLVLTLADMLQPEWGSHTPEQRNGRYADHCHINEIIGDTIDAVQDNVLEPAMPVMDLFDKLLGPLDEKLIQRLIAQWRENVWRNSARLLEIQDNQTRSQFITQVEQEALAIGKRICRKPFLNAA